MNVLQGMLRITNKKQKCGNVTCSLLSLAQESVARDKGPKGIGYRVDVPRTPVACTAWYTALWRFCSSPTLRLLFLVQIVEDNNGSMALSRRASLSFLLTYIQVLLVQYNSPYAN